MDQLPEEREKEQLLMVEIGGSAHRDLRSREGSSYTSRGQDPEASRERMSYWSGEGLYGISTVDIVSWYDVGLRVHGRECRALHVGVDQSF